MPSYHQDAELVAFNFAAKGRDNIKRYFEEGLIKRSGKITVVTTEAYFESDDTISFTMSTKSENLGTVIARDALYLKDGKIFRHIALTLPSEKDKRLCEGLK